MTKQFPELQPTCALAVVAHPDDIEFCFGGTLAKWSQAGTAIHYLILTNGAAGTADQSVDPAALTAARRQEQQAAAAKLGVTNVTFCDYADGRLTNTYEVRMDIARVIRTCKPDVVLTLDPTMIYSAERGLINHPDHRAAGQATLDAVYPLARDHLAFPELQSEGLEPHKTATILLTNYNTPNNFIDTTDHIDAKLDALSAHFSQMSDMEPTSKLVRDMGAEFGAQADCPAAEAFVRIDIQAY